MLAGLLTTFRHELVSAVLVSAFLGVIAMPFKRIIKAYNLAALQRIEAVGALGSQFRMHSIQLPNHLGMDFTH